MNSQIQELIVNLQKEYLFTYNEKLEIQNLYNEIQQMYDELYRKKYILISQQLINNECADEKLQTEHIKRFFQLESKVNFLKLRTLYNNYEYVLTDLFKLLSSDTDLITDLLVFCDENSLNILRLCSIFYRSIVGSVVSSDDNDRIIKILLNLIGKSFNSETHPQKLIIQGKCAFIRLFRFYIDNSLSAKTFLIATLQKPIEFMLMNEDCYLDINFKLTLERLTHSEKLKLFGDPKCKTKYQENINDFRQNIINRIAEAVNMFVKSLTDSFILLPQNYVLIVNCLYQTLSNNTKLKKVDVLRSCIDFIFDCFIYPAMLHPDNHGIIGDFPLSPISKHNLTEIGKIIKTLIYTEINKIHCKSALESCHVNLPMDLLEKFEDYSMHSLISELSVWSESNISTIDLENIQISDISMDLNRSMILISDGDLHYLLKTLKCFSMKNEVRYVQLNNVLEQIKQQNNDCVLSNCLKGREFDSLVTSLQEPETIEKSKFYCKPEDIELVHNSVNNLNILILIIDPFVECPGMKSEEKVMKESKDNENFNYNSHKSSAFDGQKKNRGDILSNSLSSFGCQSSRRDSSSSRSCVSSAETNSSCRKLINTSNERVPDGILKTDDSNKPPVIDIASVGSAFDTNKRKTHFNELNDQESVGLSSDFVEGTSEVASTHSVHSEDVDSRIDPDESNDPNRIASIGSSNLDSIIRQTNTENLILVSERDQPVSSDMVISTTCSLIQNSSVTDLEELRTGVGGLDDGSSDVVYWQNSSGRNTPSISGGRESPSSSVGGSDLPNNSKADITDKFCKFDIPKTVEARSTVSDTWSTDVLASDSETTEQGDHNKRLVEIQEENFSIPIQRSSGSEDIAEIGDASVKQVSNSLISEKSVVTKSYQENPSSSQQAQTANYSVARDDVPMSNVHLDTMLTCSLGVRIKSNSHKPSTSFPRVIRNHGSLPFLNKDDDKPRSYNQNVVESLLSESPSSSRRGLVNKIKDKFSGSKIKGKTLKPDADARGLSGDELSGKIDEKSNPEISESVEQMLLRYCDKSVPKSPDYASILTPNSDDQSTIPATFDTKSPPETWPVWKLAKRSLRMILEKHYVKISYEKLLYVNRANTDTNPVIRLLRIYLAEAHHLQQDCVVAQLEETLRILQYFDNDSVCKMISSMLKDWKHRKCYITYLVNTHTELRLVKKRAEELLLRCKRSCQVASRSMISFCIHEILREQHPKFEDFFRHFYAINSESSCFSIAHKCDDNKFLEKPDFTRAQLVSDMLEWAGRILNSQPYLSAMTPERQQETKLYLERFVMSQLYRSSITLNDDLAEIERDSVFHRELEGLQKVISPSHLAISKKFHCLLPFEAALNELLKINCYKTPLDKIFCIHKTTQKIAVLLKMTNSDLIPGADDILPVLIYVIIMANPPRLLSNMSFIEALCGNQLEGQDQYTWCQFTAAVNEVRRLLTTQTRYSIKK